MVLNFAVTQHDSVPAHCPSKKLTTETVDFTVLQQTRAEACRICTHLWDIAINPVVLAENHKKRITEHQSTYYNSQSSY